MKVSTSGGHKDGEVRGLRNGILFISHSANHTGAAIVLLRFVEWLKANTRIPFEVVIKVDGDLRSDFESLAPTSVYRPPGIIQKVAWRMNIDLERYYCKRYLLKKYKMSPIGLIYANTATIGKFLSGLADLYCPAICHVHELESWINRDGMMSFNLTKRYATHYIAASEAVRQNLVQRHGICERNIDVVHAFIDCSAFANVSRSPRHMRKLLNIPEDAFVIGGSGSGEAVGKGKDLFVQLAFVILSKFDERPVHFVWVGGQNEGRSFHWLQHDIEHAGLSGRVHFVPEVHKPSEYFNAIDVFAMVSREDSFPLVNLEAAVLGKPVVCFENAGGSPEFVEHDAGFCVPYLDVHSMADKLISLARDEELRRKLGSRAAQKARQRHDVSVAAPKILEVINRLWEHPG